MNKEFDVIKYTESILGDNKAEFIAKDLKETYNDLAQELRFIADGAFPNNAPIYSYDPKEESDKIMDMMEALAVVYSWYACDNIKDF